MKTLEILSMRLSVTAGSFYTITLVHRWLTICYRRLDTLPKDVNVVGYS